MVLGTLPLIGASVGVQTSPTLGGWVPAPISAAQVTPDGRVIVPAAAAAGFFRLEIALGGGPLVATEETPEVARRVLADFLARHNQAGSELDNTADGEAGGPFEAGPVAALLFDPTVDEGRTPAYVEFKLLRAGPATAPPAAGRVFAGRPEETDARRDAGYVTVSLTAADLPVASHAFAGSARFERLLANAGGRSPARLVRFDDAFMVAEDAAGGVIASLGSAPYTPDPALVNAPEDGFELALGTAALPPSVGPAVTGREPTSYAAFLQEWRTDPVIARARAGRAALAEEAWWFVGDGPKTLTVALRQSLVLNPSGPAAVRAESADPGVIGVTVDAASGQVTATAFAEGDALVTLWDAGGRRTVCLVETPSPGLHDEWVPGKKAGWFLAKEHLVSSWAEQRKYNQVLGDAQMCTGTVSGCGPTAWAMYFGHWDRKGYPKLFADPALADAPEFMGNPTRQSILDCLRYVFDAVDEVCFNKLDRAATLPSKMHLGLEWSSQRGVGSTGTLKWGVPYLCPGAQSKALDSLNAGRISIVGIGVYSHYPVAYGYRRWEWRSKKGKVWKVDYHLRLNMGWGAAHEPEWRDIGQLWYATNLRPQ